MEKFYVLWTYTANYSLVMEIEARTESEAASKVCNQYGPEFARKATIYVMRERPFIRKGSDVVLEGK